jgi:hypothetical protein
VPCRSSIIVDKKTAPLETTVSRGDVMYFFAVCNIRGSKSRESSAAPSWFTCKLQPQNVRVLGYMRDGASTYIVSHPSFVFSYG